MSNSENIENPCSQISPAPLAPRLLGGTDGRSIEQHRIANDKMRKASGHVKSGQAFTHFLYLLARDHLPPGTIESILDEVCDVRNGIEITYTNGWLAQWAGYSYLRMENRVEDASLAERESEQRFMGW